MRLICRHGENLERRSPRELEFRREGGGFTPASRRAPEADPSGRGLSRAFTLTEVVVSLALAVLVFGGILATYIQGAYRAERAGFSLAAQGLAIQQLEQARAAKWDILDTPNVDEITNLVALSGRGALLDLPVSGTNTVWATNYISVSLISVSSNPVVNLHVVKVDTVWPHRWMGKQRYFTNTLCCYFAPDR